MEHPLPSPMAGAHVFSRIIVGWLINSSPWLIFSWNRIRATRGGFVFWCAGDRSSPCGVGPYVFLHSDNKNTEILRLKRRFLKDQSSRDVFFAKQEIKRKKLREVRQDCYSKMDSLSLWQMYSFLVFSSLLFRPFRTLFVGFLYSSLKYVFLNWNWPHT